MSLSAKRRCYYKKIKPYVKTFFQRADIFLLVMCIICSLFGIAAIHKAVTGMSAGGWSGMENPTKFIVVQVFSMFLGIGMFVIFTVIDSDLLGEQWKALCVINVLLIIALVLLGQDDGTGNKSWIRFAGIGIQPSEVIKVLYIVVSAKQMTYLKEYKDINSFMSVVQMAGHFVIVFGMIVVVSGDLGSAAILISVFWSCSSSSASGCTGSPSAARPLRRPFPCCGRTSSRTIRKKRLVAPYDPTVDPDGWGITWQTTQSKLTLASGRFTGVEEGHRASVFTGKHTDFIFACIGENYGMLGCLLVVLLLMIIIVRCAYIGLHAGRTFDMLVCMGVTAAVAFQTFINIGMCLGITPVIGITLPFFSYGGSSMVTMFGAMGLVSGTKFKPKPQHGSLLY